MSYASLLIDSCDIQRFSLGAADAYGNLAKSWANLHAAEPCRWSTPSNREVRVGAEVVLADLILFVGDITITEQDRVVIGTMTYEILSVIPCQDGTGAHHKECLLRTVE
jgi:hypothetical protein